MKFTPVDMDNLESNIWKEGAYRFRIIDACESNQYGPQLQLDLEVEDGHHTKKLRTWIGAQTRDGKPDLRLMFLCRSVGLIDRYKTGEILDGDCMHKRGYVQVGVGHTKSGDKVNTVNKFLTAEEFNKERNKHNDHTHVTQNVSAPSMPEPPEFEDSDLPF